MLRVCPPLQIPDEDVPVMASRQDDPGVERVWLQDKHLSLVALNKNAHVSPDLEALNDQNRNRTLCTRGVELL